MNDLWNSKCVLLSYDGNIYESSLNLKNHNESIAECSKQIGLNIDSNQAMTSMLEVLAKSNNIILLNAGYGENKKRTGYLTLPENIFREQLANCVKLKLLLDEYESITVWQIINNSLKSVSFGDPKYADEILQKLIDKSSIKEVEHESKI